ncbi:MAG: tetratricopeptide repeat protein [Bradymonadia bacterium]
MPRWVRGLALVALISPTLASQAFAKDGDGMVGPKMAAPPKADRVPFKAPLPPPKLEDVVEKGMQQPELLIRFVEAHPDKFRGGGVPVDVVRILAPMLLQADRAFEAENMLAQGVKMAPEDGQMQLSHGRVLLALGQRPGAIKALEKAVELMPASAEAHFTLARAYLEKRPYDDALLRKSIEVFGKTLEIAPSFRGPEGATTADIYFEIGMAYARMSRRTPQTAIGMRDAWVKALEIDPKFKPRSNPEVNATQLKQVISDLNKQLGESP